MTLAQSDLTVVAVGEAELESEKIMIFNPKIVGKMSSLSEEFIEILRNDFSFYKNTFNILKSSSVGQDFSMDDFAREKYGQVFLTTLIGSNDNFSGKISVMNVRSKTEVMNLDFEINRGNIREATHHVADQIFQKLTSRPSVFKSKIVYVSDKGSTSRNYFKELYLMDFDGHNVHKLTNFGGTVISPSMSHDNKKIVYSLIPKNKGEKNIGLYIYDIPTGKSTLVSNHPGINSGAIFDEKDENIILTLSFSGNSEIYIQNLATKALRKITNHTSDDVDPSLTAKGDRMAFLSDRPGRAMIYILDPKATEKDVKRISFIGKFNATPSFSPDGMNIVFSSWDKAFDIYRISQDGGELVRLTKDFGSNEDPNYSPDGEFIIFSSRRLVSSKNATQDIYIMDKDGGVIGSLTQSAGNCTSPRWSK